MSTRWDLAMPDCALQVDRKKCPQPWVPEIADLGPAAEGAPVFDYADLVERLRGDDLVESFIGMFITAASAALEKLRQALDRADTEGVLMQSHVLKGASATISASAMRSIAAVMEKRAWEGSLDGLPGLLVELEVAFADFLEETAAYQR